MDVCWDLWDQSGKIINKNKKAQGSNRAVTARLLPWQSLYVDICVYACTCVRGSDSLIHIELEIELGVKVEIHIDIEVEVEVDIEIEIEVEIKVEIEVDVDIAIEVEAVRQIRQQDIQILLLSTYYHPT